MNLDEKKLDELAKADFKITGWVPTEWAVMNFKRGYRQAFADQGDKIKRLEKAVELMRARYTELLTAINWYETKFSGPQHEFDHFWRVEIRGNYIDPTLAEVDSILKGAE